MPDNVVALPQRGKTYLTGPNRTADSTATVSLAIEGIKKVFKDLDYTGTAGVFAKAPRSGGEVECILARNASAISLLPGRVCVWKTNKQGKQVDGYVSLDAGLVAGVVDEWLPSTGVPTNDYFWLVRKGPCLVKKSLDGNSLVKDDYVIAITAATSQATTAGRITSILSTSNQTYAMSAALNRLGLAMSTTATTNADVLVYLDITP